ncbi:N-acetylmuramoyl-L-alanine amidase [Streptomyces sp. NPDC048560]|uniref:peptidoglycan recognition protein family protein n=1 Tax=Streptomyces sp. NPDC048560 TaxID=3155488 RepID=UPI003423B44A
MRALLATSIGVTCAAALTIPLAVPSAAAPAIRTSAIRAVPAPDRAPAEAATPAEATAPAEAATPAEATAPAEAATPAEATEPAELPGSTQSLPLSPLTPASDRATGAPTGPSASAVQGLRQRDVRPFSLVGVVWDDAATELHGTVQVRTRATGTTRWSGWQDVETHNAEHAADPGTAESESRTVRGATAPLWVGESDGVEVRVQPGATDPHDRTAAPQALPGGLRLELVDPGEAAPRPPTGGAPGTSRVTEPTAVAPLTVQSAEAAAVNADLAPLGATVIPALSKAESQAQAGVAAGAKPFIGPRPRIITRKGWGADEGLRERQFAYTTRVKAAFVHHSATGNNYRCSQAPSVLRGIYRYHVKSSGWRDFGYNFAIDKCGNIYEGRAGGVSKAVLGAHTLGFNTNSMGIAVLGTFTSTKPSAASVKAVSKLTAWKLGLFGANPKGKTTLVSGGGNRFRKGAKVRLNVISGHRDGFATECPGGRLYKKLGTARAGSARLQGR